MVYDLMLKRRSVRKFKDTVPADDLLEKLVAAAVAAPSASNKQPWRFLLVTNRSLIADAAVAVNKEVKRLASQMAPPFQEGFSQYAENFMAFAGAPVLIIPTYRVFPLLTQLLSDEAENIDAAQKVEQESSLISVSCAMQNMLLMAEDCGLGACCMTGPLLAGDEIKDIFTVLEGWDIAAFVALGFPDEQPDMPARKPLATAMKWIR